MSSHDAHGHDGGGHHVAPRNLLLGVLIILLIMTVLTVYTALYVDVGAVGNLIIALFIAIFKSALVVGFFMHLHWDNKFNAVALLYCLLAIGTFMLFTITDIGSRSKIEPVRNEIIPSTQVRDAINAWKEEHGEEAYEARMAVHDDDHHGDDHGDHEGDGHGDDDHAGDDHGNDEDH